MPLILHINEPVRRSMLDVLQDNLQIANRNIYVHRIIYIGKHSFNEEVVDVFQNIIKAVNNGYCDEQLTGILIYYQNYFCHMIEGSEDSLIKHLTLLFDEQYEKYLGPTKLLVAYHHINQRFLSEWTHFTGKPPMLLEKIDMTRDLEKTARQIYYCIQKIYKLANALRPKLIVEESNVSIPVEQSQSDIISVSSISAKKSIVQSANLSLTDNVSEFLPEYNLLDFLLQSPFVQDLSKYYSIYGFIPEMEAYEDTVWPVPCDFVPLDVFDKPFDPVTDLPPRTGTAGEKSEMLVGETEIE